MKRCPDCRRDYFDDTLLYCLDDGAALLEGPGSFEPPTARIPAVNSGAQNTITSADTKLYEGATQRSGWRKHAWVPLAAAAVGLFLIAGFAYGVYKFLAKSDTGRPPRPQAAINTQRLTGDGKTRSAVISPDGKMLAYIKTEGSERSIWLKQIATDMSIQIAKPGELDRFENLTFSPDGTYLYFNAEPAANDPPSVYRISTLGGNPTKVIDDAYGVEFSKDGKYRSFGRLDLATNESSFFVAGADGGGERKIATRTGTKFFEPEHSWSPDGKYLAAIGGDDVRRRMSILLITVSGDRDPTEIGGDWGILDDVVWHPNGDSLLVAGSDNTSNANQIWEVTFPGGEVRRLTNNLNGHNSVSITANGEAIVTGEIYSRTALWVSNDADPQKAKQVLPPSADTWGLDWTPDGRIVFASDRSGESEIWVIDADGSNARVLTSDQSFKQVPVASEDGRYIVYVSSADGGRLERIDMSGGNKFPLPETSGADNPDISKDGKWVIYSRYIDGESRVLRMPIEGGDAQMLTDYKAIEPRYSSDGTRFACFLPNETTRVWTRLAIVPADGGPPIKVFDAPANTSIARGPVWTPDDKGVTVIVNEGEKQNLWLIPVDGSPGKRMTDFDLPGVARREYSKDGKRIAIMRAEGIGNAIMITNFR